MTEVAYKEGGYVSDATPGEPFSILIKNHILFGTELLKIPIGPLDRYCICTVTLTFADYNFKTLYSVNKLTLT